MSKRSHAGWREFFRVFVPQLIQGKRTAVGDFHRVRDGAGQTGIDRLDSFTAPQMTLRIGKTMCANLIDGGSQPDGR